MAAASSGASAVGFILDPRSPRYVAPKNLESWIGQIRSVICKVGVFVNETPARVASVAAQLSLDVVQLHGDEPPEDVPRGLRTWKAARIGNGLVMDSINEYAIEALLIDGPAAGIPFDWRMARNFRGNIILAGGLDASNVRAAIETARPWGVDASSRLESCPGKKDHRKMADFIEAALSC